MSTLKHSFGLTPEQQKIREMYEKFAEEIEPLVKASSTTSWLGYLVNSCGDAVKNARPAPRALDERLPERVKELLTAGETPRTVEYMPAVLSEEQGEDEYHVVWTTEETTILSESDLERLKGQMSGVDA